MSRKNRKEPSIEFQADDVKPQLKKKFHLKDLARIQPITEKQEDMFDAWEDYPEKHLFLCGSAGTGKTFLALFVGLRDLLTHEFGYEKVLIVRSAVQSREIGFTPGTLEEKIALYETPYSAICDELFEFSKSYENLKKLGMVDFQSSSFLRGQTFNDTIIIVDECQNMTEQELDTIVTRVGRNSRIIFCGDIRQTDLNKKRYDVSGFPEFYEIVVNMEEHFEMIEFGPEDIVRSDFVKAYILAKEKLDK